MKITISNLGMPRAWLPPKLLLIMKLIVIILITCLMQVSAHSVAQKLTYVKSNATIKEIFKEITKQTGYEVLYANKVVNDLRKINAAFKSTPLKEVLDKCLEKQDLIYSIDESKGIVIKEKEPSLLDRLFHNDEPVFADIRGVLRNEKGEPLEGITVSVKGAKAGTRTNDKGEFLLKGVKKGDILVFTGVAIETFEYTVKDDKNIDLNLKARLVQLEEVAINTGYQKVSKERYVGSYSQLDSAAFHRRAGMGILERLDGTIAGVLFNKKGSTVPNAADESPLQIRGLSTLNSNQNPLIVVDNFPYPFDLSTLNPNDVENITVLKDAAAASIWGARAGNGVIVITTKKGKYNQPIQVSSNSNVTISGKPKLYSYPSISSSDFIEVEKFLFERGHYASLLGDENRPPITPVVEILDRIDRGVMTETNGTAEIEALAKHDYRKDLLEYVYKQQVSQQHNVSLSGGNQLMGYRLSLGYNRNGATIQNAKDDDQFTINTTASFKPGKRFNISTGIALTQDVQKRGALNFKPGLEYPYAKLADENWKSLAVPGLYRMGYVDTAGAGKLLDWHFRPLDEINFSNNKNTSRAINLSLDATYQITDWLNVQASGQYAVSNGDRRNLYSLSTYFTRDLINRFTNLSSTDPTIRYPLPMGAVLDYGVNKSVNYNLRGQLNFSHSWNENNISGLVSADISESNSSANSGRIYGYNEQVGSFNSYINYNQQYPKYGTNNGNLIPQGGGFLEKSIRRLVSLTGNLSYTFKNRYTFYASARRDAANLFGVETNNKWKPLWSVGSTWNIKEENFELPLWISDLKLKTTHGYMGNVNNSQIPNATIAYQLNPAPMTGFQSANVNTPPSPKLRWEEVRFTNVGLDFSLLNNKIDGSVEFYQKSTKDLIAPVALPNSTGLDAYNINSATLKGHGLDINLGATVTKGRFSWNPRFGLGYAKMKVVEIFSPNPMILARDYIYFTINPAAGQLAYAISSFKWAGLDPATGDPQGYYQGAISKDYEKILYDTLGNQNLHGSAIPLTSGFLSNTFNWKHLSLSLNITYKLNYYFRKPALNYGDLFSSGIGTDDYAKRWQKPGDENFTTVPSMIYPDPTYTQRDLFYQYSEINVSRGDHIKLQDLRLEYRFNKSELRVVNQLNVFCYLNNLNIMIWKKDNSPFDPEFVGGTVFIPPSPISVAFGLNISL